MVIGSRRFAIAAIAFIAGVALANTAVAAARPARLFPAYRSSQPLLYVADSGSNAVLIYSELTPGSPIGQITTGISGPAGMRVDSVGNLYVANSNGANVTVYAPGQTQPARTLSSGLVSPSGVAVAADGTVYVSDFNGNLVVYPPGASQPSLTVPPPSFASGSYTPGAADVALGARGQVYVTYYSADYVLGLGYVYAYDGGFAHPRQLPLFLDGSSQLDVDKAGDVVAAFQYGPHYSQTSYLVRMSPAGKMLGEFDENQFPYVVRLSSDDRRLYTDDSFFHTNVVRVLAYPGGHLLRRIVDSLPTASISGVAVSPAPRP